jgi:uncharacterized protein (DUF1919 family)
VQGECLRERVFFFWNFSFGQAKEKWKRRTKSELQLCNLTFFSLPKESNKEKARQNDASALSEILPDF